MGHSTTRLTYETYYKWLPSESTSDISDLDNGRQVNLAVVKK